MADIYIERPHQLSSEALKARLEEMESKLAERYGVRLTWAGTTADVKGSGVSGTLTISPTAVVVSLKLGLLVRPFKSKIEETMERQLVRALA